MKILHLSNTPLSNSPANLAQIQRDHGHDAQVLLHRQQNTNKVFVGGTVWTSMDSEQITASLKSADILHFHNFAWEQQLFQTYPHLIDVALKKPCLIQYHSPRNSTENFEDTLQDPFFKGRRAVVAQYQVRLYPECEYVVPNVLPIFSERFKPLNRPLEPLSVTFSPSNTHMRGWDDKGVSIVRETFRMLQRFGLAAPEIIINTPYEETMIKKKWSHVGLEEVVTGSYHLSFLEYMALGSATLCNMDEMTKEAMAHVVGHDAVAALPCFFTSAATLTNDLFSVLKYPTFVKSRGNDCRKWMETHWNPETFVQYFNGIYEKL